MRCLVGPQAGGTIASQIAALEARVIQRGSAWSLITASSMTATAEHADPAGPGAAARYHRGRAIDRLYVHSPDRLARRYAYQVLLIDEFQRAGIE